MRRITPLSLFFILISFSSFLFAENDELEPSVVITDRGSNKVEEFRTSGRVYMIRITPNKGRPYYLIDADGDGNLETHRSEMSPRLLIPSWVIVSW